MIFPFSFRGRNGRFKRLGGVGIFNQSNDLFANGSIVVGIGISTLGQEAFIWDVASGMQNLQAVLEGQLGLDLTGWILMEANGVSADGLTVVDRGINPQGFTE